MNENSLIGDIPKRGAEWSEISEYCYSFRGHNYWGSIEKVAEVAKKNLDKYKASGDLPESVVILRTILFFEQRRIRHHNQYPPNTIEDDLELVRVILNKLREIED